MLLTNGKIKQEGGRMPTKRQHYVPQVYLKAWETEVEKITNADCHRDGSVDNIKSTWDNSVGG